MKRSISHASKTSEDVQDTRESNMPGIAKTKWKEILEKEDNDLFILGIREEIVQNCINICYENYLKRQSVAFTVHCAYLAWVKVIDIYNMFKDPGDIDISEVQKSWEPDNEPQPSIIDSWGSHCVIAVPMRPTKTEHVKEKVVVVEEKTEPKSEKDTTETESFPSSIYENPEEFYYSNIYSEYETPISGTEKSIFSRTLSMSKDSLPLMAPTSSRNCQKSLCTKRNKRSCDKPNNKT